MGRSALAICNCCSVKDWFAGKTWFIKFSVAWGFGAGLVFVVDSFILDARNFSLVFDLEPLFVLLLDALFPSLPLEFFDFPDRELSFALAIRSVNLSLNFLNILNLLGLDSLIL